MIRFRRGALVLTASAAVLTVAGCGPAGTGKSASTAASSSSAMPTDAAGLSTLLRDSSAKIHSAHLDLTVDAGTTKVTGSGDETLAGGKLQSLDLSETLPNVGAMRVILTGGKTYLQLPTSLTHSPKPWVLVTATSTNPAVRQLATTLQSVQQAAALDQFTSFSSAATVTKHTEETLNGARATHYSLTVDVQKLPDTLPGKQQLVTAGLTTLPIEMWVDDQGRPVKFSEDLTVQTQHVSTVVTIGKFDAPVTVTPPPADQVATD